MKPQWAPNVDEFKKRFDPERTKGQGGFCSEAKPARQFGHAMQI